MEERMTKAKLLDTMQREREKWEALLAEVGEARLAQPGAAGYWTVKDIVGHINDYERWVLIRLQAALRGEDPPERASEKLDLEGRNTWIYEQNKNRSVQDVLAESRQIFRDLVEVVQAHSEAFLMNPQQFHGLSEPIVPRDYVASDAYGHYEEHAPSMREWLAQLNASAT